MVTYLSTNKSYCAGWQWRLNQRQTVDSRINMPIIFHCHSLITDEIRASNTEILRGIMGYFQNVRLWPSCPTQLNSKQIWGNGSQALMLSDRLWAGVAEGVMGDERARRGRCLWQLKLLGLRAKHRVRARPRWWARPHCHCQKDDVASFVSPLLQALRNLQPLCFSHNSLFR